VVEPPTAQKPHPPIWMAAGSPGSIAKVAERGYKLLLDQYASTAAVIDRLNLYKSETEKRGRTFDPMDVALCRGFYVAKDAADKARAIENRLVNQRRTQGLAQAPDNSNKSVLLSYADTAAASDDSAMYGSPDEIISKLEVFRKAGFQQVLLNGPAGSRENLRAFAHNVMPAFAETESRPAGRARPALVNP
jgi:alkanesulfonate monooxygenase SsuD/methylene tetrahydromethanopterin reductase-like flavin-dependent oxidoreductase (luciferase family)